MISFRTLILLCVMFVLTNIHFLQAKEHFKWYVVERVVDGDTLDLAELGRVRLIGVDTPESVHPRKPVEYFALEASKFLNQLAFKKKVRVELDQQTEDRYGRLLAYLYLEDGRSINEEIIKQGYGHAYTKFPFKKMEDFRRLEREARIEKIGLWADSKTDAQPTEIVENIGQKTGEFSCFVHKTCKQMSGCAEAKFYFATCNKRRLDGDKDGIPCENVCP